MEPLQGHLKGFSKNVILDEETMLSIARMIAYVTVFSTHRTSSPAEMTQKSIAEDAKTVDKWLLSKANDE